MCKWNNEIIRFAMTVDRVIGLLDAFVVFLLILLAGDGIRLVVNL